MNFDKLKEIIDSNNISYDVELLSDSNWECSETIIGSIFYNEEDNIIVCNQPHRIEKTREYNNKIYKLIYDEYKHKGDK